MTLSVFRRFFLATGLVLFLIACNPSIKDDFLLNQENFISLDLYTQIIKPTTSIIKTDLGYQVKTKQLDIVIRSLELIPCNNKYHNILYQIDNKNSQLQFIESAYAGHSGIIPVTRLTETLIQSLDQIGLKKAGRFNVPNIGYCSLLLVIGEEKIIENGTIVKLPSISARLELENPNNEKSIFESQSNFTYGRKLPLRIDNNKPITLTFHLDAIANQINFNQEESNALIYSILKNYIDGSTLNQD